MYHGQNLGQCLCGPFKVKDIQLNGPVTSVALFLKRSAMDETTSSTWHCNLLVTCAIGQALVYEDLFGAFDHIGNGEVLMDSDAFDSIFAGITADIDLVRRLHIRTPGLVNMLTCMCVCDRMEKLNFYWEQTVKLC